MSRTCSCHKPVVPTDCGCHDRENDHGHSHDHDEDPAWLRRIIIPAVLFLAGLGGGGALIRAYGPAPLAIMMAAAYLFCGYSVLADAGRAVLRKDFFNEFTLMSLATLVAFVIGEDVEAVGVMLFYAIGENLQEMAAGKSRRSIAGLLAGKPDTARLVVDGRTQEVSPDSVPVGSTILVLPGDKIPLDGAVVSGSASLDMSSLTGESVPAGVGPGDKVFSGSISLDGDLTITSTAVASDSMAGVILNMVEHAVAAKSRTERFITSFSRYYTPAVVLLAFLTAVLPPFLAGQAWNVWVYRALVLLVVSCPCALVLSVPLAYFAGIGAASRHGLLVKGGLVLDALTRVDAVVFDKTGTLTDGKPALAAVAPAAGVSRETLLQLAALAESRSTHPLARAVMAAAGAAPETDAALSIKSIPGQGIIATCARGTILAGNAKLLRESGVAFAAASLPGSAVFIALNGVYQGGLSFADTVKKDAAAALKALKAQGYTLHMLTGDNEEAATAVAKTLALDSFRAGLLPQDKVSALSSLTEAGRAAFVGDGINDAPVLATAHVGIAMGGLGSAAAIEAADAVILDDSPSRLPVLFRIARHTRSIATQNIALALITKAVIMTLGLLDVTGLWSAIFADTGVTLLAVLNTLRRPPAGE